MRKPRQSIPAPRRTSAPHGMTPTILAHAAIVTVLVSAPWDAWHDQWMAQATDETGIDYFDDVFRMFTPAAVGMATTALRAHTKATGTIPGRCLRSYLAERPCILRSRPSLGAMGAAA